MARVITRQVGQSLRIGNTVIHIKRFQSSNRVRLVIGSDEDIVFDDEFRERMPRADEITPRLKSRAAAASARRKQAIDPEKEKEAKAILEKRGLRSRDKQGSYEEPGYE